MDLLGTFFFIRRSISPKDPSSTKMETTEGSKDLKIQGPLIDTRKSGRTGIIKNDQGLQSQASGKSWGYSDRTNGQDKLGNRDVGIQL